MLSSSPTLPCFNLLAVFNPLSGGFSVPGMMFVSFPIHYNSYGYILSVLI